MSDEARTRFYSLLRELMRTNGRLFLLIADIGEYPFKPLADEFPDRYINVAISEQAMVGMAAGLAQRGYYPVMFTWSPFMVERVYEQIKIDLSYRGFPAILVSVAGSYDYGKLGMTHHCPADVGILYNVPGCNILLPGGASEFETLFTQAAQQPGLYYFRLSYRGNNVEYFDTHIGQAITAQEGWRGLIVVAGDALNTVMDADIADATILYYPTIRPFDANAIRENSAPRILVVEPYYSTLPLLVSQACDWDAIIRSVAVPRRPITELGTPDEIDVLIGFTPAGIRAAYEGLCNA